MREYFQDQMDSDVVEGNFEEVERLPILMAIESAEEVITSLLVETESSEHIAEGFSLPALDIANLKSKRLSVKKAIIDALEDRRAKYTTLKIFGVLDKAGAKAVYDARIEMKNIRIHFEKAGKRMTEEAKSHIKDVGIEGKKLIGLASVTEDYLEAEEKAYEALVNAEKAAKQKIMDERNQGRVDALLLVGAKVGLAEIVLMTDETFNSYLDLATKSHMEKARIASEAAAAESARIEAEAQKIRAEREANAKAKADNDRMAAELKAQMDVINKQKADIERAQRDDEIRKEAEAKARADSETKAIADRVKAEKEASGASERIEAMKAKAVAIDAAKPDAEKLFSYAETLKAVTPTEMGTDAGRAARNTIIDAHERFLNFIRKQADSLTK